MPEYNLEIRTTEFAKRILGFVKVCPKNTVTLPLIDQVLRSGTSIGANYHEANGASSKTDFRNKIFICIKEAKETMYWLELFTVSLDNENAKKECQNLWHEAKELTLIFSKISSSCKS